MSPFPLADAQAVKMPWSLTVADPDPERMVEHAPLMSIDPVAAAPAEAPAPTETDPPTEGRG